MSKAEQLFHDIAKEVKATEGKMFGALCLKAPNGKAAMFLKNDHASFKLDEKAEKEAMKLDGAKTFNPSGKKPMNGWTELSFDHADRWKAFAKSAMAFVKTLD